MQTQYKQAIVRLPASTIARGITTANLGAPNYVNAMRQHSTYRTTLSDCGVNVLILAADDAYPDCCFIEDTAVVTEKCAIITRPGAITRWGEPQAVIPIIKHFKELEFINDPGTVDGGDILRIEDHFYIGISERTNQEGGNQLKRLLEKHGYSASFISVAAGLHLKTSVNYIRNNNLLITKDFVAVEEFQKYNLIELSQEEEYAANSIYVNDTLIIPQGYPKLRKAVIDLGYSIMEVDVSEFRKVDGGLSCLSLLF